MHGVPLQPAGAQSPGQLDIGDGRACHPRSAQPAVPKLHSLSPEGAWFLCESGIHQMRILLAFLIAAVIAFVAFAQAPAPPAQPPAKAPATPEAQAEAAAAAPAKVDDQAKPAEPATPAIAASPVPASGEQWITGSVDLGYRWVGEAGNLPTYRSTVNLGSGPKLTGLDFTITDPKHRLFDRIDARANS